MAWNELETERDFIGMDAIARPIPFTALDAYARRYGYSGERFEHLRYCLREMESVYMEHQRELRKKPGRGRIGGSPKPPPKPPPKRIRR